MANGILIALAAATVGGPLQAVVVDLQNHVAADQTVQIRGAIDASPALKAQLNDVAATGKLKGFRVGSAAQVATTGPFAAATAQGYMVFTADFLVQQKDNRHFQFGNSQIFPDNLVFDLGHLAYHLKKPDGSPQSFADAKAYVQDRATHEAGAYIQGWNDLIDAAVQENGGKSLTAPEVGLLLMNFRYRFALLAPTTNPADSIFGPGGHISENEKNTSTIFSNLMKSKAADLQ